MLEADLNKELGSDIIVKMVELYTFVNKKKLTEFEKVLVVSGACAFETILKTLAEQTEDRAQFREMRMRILADMTNFMTNGPGWKVHEFYCDGCEKHSKKPEVKQ